MASDDGVLERALRYVRRPDIREDPLRLVARRAWYEAARRVGGARAQRTRAVRLDGDLRLRVDVGDEVGGAVYRYGVYEYYAASVFKALVAPGAVVVDGGANIGQYTLLAAKRAGPAGRVLAFEPDPGTFPSLAANLALNPGLEADLIPCALAARRVALPLYRSPQEHNAGLSSLRPPGTHPSSAVREGDGDGATAMVQCVRLDDVLEERGIASLDVVKLDVEGYELEALRGGAAAIEAHRPAILVEVNDLQERDGAHSAPVIDWLRERGYRLFGCRPEPGDATGWRLAELAPGEDPRRYKEHWQMRPSLAADPFPEISPNLVALHPARDRLADRRDAAR